MLPASMLLDLKHPAYAWYVMVMYLAYLTTLDPRGGGGGGGTLIFSYIRRLGSFFGGSKF